MRTDSVVGFGDADSFYASAEAVRRPWLAGLPVGVLGNQGACVIARNYPMKKYGVTVGEPIWEAKRKCPAGVYVKRDFRWYETLSRQLLETIGDTSPFVEYYSIDEFFWAGRAAKGLSFQQTAERLRDTIKQTIGVPMTVSFARTRTLAKLFADTAKPNGAVAVLDQSAERDRLAQLPVTEIAGIGGRRARRLEPYGIRTCLDLADARGPLVKQVLTLVGYELWQELNGVPVTPIRPARTPHKMIARGGSLAGRVTDAATLYGWLVRNTERLVEELHFHEVRTSELVLYLSILDEPGGGAAVNLGVPSDRFDVLLAAAKYGLRRAWRHGSTATHMHLIASRLVRNVGGWQQSLFDPPDPRQATLARVKQQINDRYGRFKLRSGATLFANAFYQDPANEYEICDVRGKFCF
jgi:DNA polymerase V